MTQPLLIRYIFGALAGYLINSLFAGLTGLEGGGFNWSQCKLGRVELLGKYCIVESGLD